MSGTQEITAIATLDDGTSAVSYTADAILRGTRDIHISMWPGHLGAPQQRLLIRPLLPR